MLASTMRLRDHLQEVVWSFRKQRLRTALTAIGIGIGAFAIAIMVGLAQGIQAYVAEQFAAFGDRRVLFVFPEVARPAMRLLERISRIGRPAEPLDEEDLRMQRRSRGGLWISPAQLQALRALDGVASVAPLSWLEVDGVALAPAADAPHPQPAAAPPGTAPQTESTATAAAGGAAAPPQGSSAAARAGEGAPADPPAEPPGLTWYEIDFATMSNSPLLGTPSAGRLPEDEEPAAVVLAPQYAESFGVPAGQLLGREVLLRVPYLGDITSRFLYRDPSRYRPRWRIFRARVVGLAELSPFSRAVYASLPLARAMMRYQSGNPELLSEDKLGFQVLVRITPEAELGDLKRRIEALGLSARTVDDELRNVQRAFFVIDLALSSFGLLALLVASFGIVNTLLMSISERTREIGVMKALGASEGTIRRLFALEAAAIGLAGGLGGTAAAIGAGLLGNALVRRHLPLAEALAGYEVFSFPPWLLAGTIGFCTVLGGLAGLYPAARAARLDPVEALRRE
ncbi:MAG: hypothetical protein KatS3mg102_0501 [Planctomycetota bacterium]|nr:MAG: hypothetical protein KatS3mg102_0501 [Planctomycetota bacterium]